MVKIARKAYTLEFKQEAVRLVERARFRVGSQPWDCGTDVSELGEGSSGRQASGPANWRENWSSSWMMTAALMDILACPRVVHRMPFGQHMEVDWDTQQSVQQ